MKEKLGAVFFCLAFAVLFGGVGVFATWAIAATIHDGMRARDWVRVRAYVESLDGSEARYRYTFQGRDYPGSRMGASPLGGGDNIDDWSADLQHRLAAAKAEGHPITILVDPDKPSDSMIDATIRWNFLLFLVPFALGFGGGGVGALYALSGVFRGKRAKREAAPRGAGLTSDASTGLVSLWVFAFFWNVISFPIALLFVPQIINDGEWVGLLVLLFALIGLFLVWTAAKGTWAYLRRGGATLKLRDDKPRIGSPLEGTVDFARGVIPGDVFHVNLLCRRSLPQGDDMSISTRWNKQVDARATTGPGGARIAFRIEMPGHLPATSEASSVEGESFQWRIEVNPANQVLPIPCGFDLEMRPAPVESRAVAGIFAALLAIPFLVGLFTRF